MARSSLRSRRGIATALGTAFFIILVLVSLFALWAVSSYHARYQDTAFQMTKWDTERISEDLYIRGVNTSIRQIGQQKYNFSVVVDNTGGVAVNIARIYFLDQTNNQLNISNPINGSASQPRLGFNFSLINVGEVSHIIAANVTTKLRTALISVNPCRIVLTTDRGRRFSYSYPPPSGYGSGGGGYALVIDDDHENFQYASGTNPTFKMAYVKPKGTDNTVYRVLLRNTTPRDIVLKNNCTMNQAIYAGGANTVRYIVQNTSLPTGLVAFSTQTVKANSSMYVYFAAQTQGGTSFASEPTKPDIYMVAFILVFNYVGESEIRHFGTPILTQQLT